MNLALAIIGITLWVAISLVILIMYIIIAFVTYTIYFWPLLLSTISLVLSLFAVRKLVEWEN